MDVAAAKPSHQSREELVDVWSGTNMTVILWVQTIHKPTISQSRPTTWKIILKDACRSYHYQRPYYGKKALMMILLQRVYRAN